MKWAMMSEREEPKRGGRQGGAHSVKWAMMSEMKTQMRTTVGCRAMYSVIRPCASGAKCVGVRAQVHVRGRL